MPERDRSFALRLERKFHVFPRLSPKDARVAEQDGADLGDDDRSGRNPESANGRRWEALTELRGFRQIPHPSPTL